MTHPPLRQLPPHLRAFALAEALRIARADLRPSLEAGLLELASPRHPAWTNRAFGVINRVFIGLLSPTLDPRLAASTAIASCFQDLSPAAREVALAIHQSKPWAIHNVVRTDPRTSVQASLACLAGASDDSTLLPLLEAQLTASDNEVVLAAEHALMQRASRLRRNAREDGRALLDLTTRALQRRAAAAPAGVDRISPALGEAVTMLATALLLPREMLRESEDPIVRALARGLHTSTTHATAARAVRLLAAHALARPALVRLNRARSKPEVEAMLAQSHLLLSATRSERVRPCVLPPRSMVHSLSARAAQSLPRWTRNLASDASTKEHALEPLLSHEDPLVRAHLALHAPSRLAREVAWDAHPVPAMLAASRMIDDAQARGQQPALAPLARSPHALVRALVRCITPSLPLEEPQVAIKRLRDAAHPSIAEHEALDALRTLRSPALARACEPELLALSTHHSARVRARAITHLGVMQGRRACDQIMARTHDEDERVRANAIEALARWQRRAHVPVTQSFVDLTTRHHPHRARANAIVALAMLEPKTADAATSAALAMLRDERAPHQAAGLWASRRLLASTLAEDKSLASIHPARAALAQRVAEIAEHDALTPHTRASAASLTSWLRGEAPPQHSTLEAGT